MKTYQFLTIYLFTATLLAFSSLKAEEKGPSEEMLKIMQQPKYTHAFWGMYVKDMQNGEVLFDLNSDKLFSPASTTKLFSVAALLKAYGDDYRFKTPVYAVGEIQNGKLQGNLILVAQGDLTLGGRQSDSNKISFTKLDHINANEIPGVLLTKENPLNGLEHLAKQVYEKGIREIQGDVLVDDRLFETIQKRQMTLSPILINENLIDIVINPAALGEPAHLTWRPQVPGYVITNRIETVAKNKPLKIEITSDESEHHIFVQGSIPIDQKEVVRTFAVKDPNNFARAAFIQALHRQGIKVNSPTELPIRVPSSNSYDNLEPTALWTSPPLYEYAKLILKVSHNLGADLIPLLLAAKQGKKTFDEGMLLLGNFAVEEIQLSPDMFVFADAAGGNENRLTPKGEVQLLEYINNQPKPQFQHFFDSLPILGIDGSLEDFAKNSLGSGKVRAKPGTGVSFNLAIGKYFLITQALGGYIEGKNGHLIAYMLTVNNATMPSIDDVFPIFEDVGQLSSIIYNKTNPLDFE